MKILFVSGSVGLGHVVRDVAIARELRECLPEVEIHWLAGHPATLPIQDAGETVLPESEDFRSYSAMAEKVAGPDFEFNILKYGFRTAHLLLKNMTPIRRALARHPYDLVLGDETYEIMAALMDGRLRLRMPYVMIWDFFGNDPMTDHMLERVGNYLLNLTWLRAARLFTRPGRVALFVGEPEDVPDKRLGWLLPNQRRLAERTFQFVGHIVRFDPEKFADRSAVRAELGYGSEPLIVCSIGGTGIGRGLLQLCCDAWPLLVKAIPGARLLLVGGPRLQEGTIKVPQGVQLVGYVPDLYKHLAACDVAIVQAGGSTTLELTALRKQFLYFPLQGHAEQEMCVCTRLARHGAGIRMHYGQTTPATLADAVISAFGRPVGYPPIRADGAKTAATIIAGILARNGAGGLRPQS
jgi:UDP-N-acetylglucosamine:LPS N-acetylglucosamine transferase